MKTLFEIIHVSSSVPAWKEVFIYDVTISYSSKFPQNEKEFVNGLFPECVHFHIKRYSSRDIPDSDDGAADWCNQLWKRKEKYLEAFYSDVSQQRTGTSVPKRSWSLNLRFLIVVLFWITFLVSVMVVSYYFFLVPMFLFGLAAILTILSLRVRFGCEDSTFELLQAMYCNSFFPVVKKE